MACESLGRKIYTGFYICYCNYIRLKLIFYVTVMKLRLLLQTCATAVAFAALVPSTQASIVMDWNAIALNAIDANSTSAPEAGRNLATLHAAIYDAVIGIDGSHQTFHVAGAAPAGASKEAAAASAAKAILSQLYPTMAGAFETLYQTQIDSIADSPARTAGINWGSSVATQTYNWRLTDGASNAATTPYTPSGLLGGWAQTPPAYQYPPDLPGWGNVTPFAMTSSNQLRPTGPAALSSLQYAADYQQVYELGARNGSLRTADQTEAALFWADRTGTVTTTGHWNQIARHLLGVESGIVNEALVLAALNVTMADAGIAAWDAKYAYDRWRPLNGIAYGDFDGNDLTVGDILAGSADGWQPLLDNPATPEYLSEHATLSAAAAEILKHYLGDVGLTYWGDTDGDGIGDTLRTWASLTDASDEAGMAQIYAGINFAYSVNDGQTTGENVASHVLNNYFAQIPEPGALLMGLSALSMVLIRRRRPVPYA